MISTVYHIFVGVVVFLVALKTIYQHEWVLKSKLLGWTVTIALLLVLLIYSWVAALTFVCTPFVIFAIFARGWLD